MLRGGYVDAKVFLDRNGERLLVNYTAAVTEEMRPHLDKILRLMHAKVEASFKLGSVLPSEFLMEDKK